MPVYGKISRRTVLGIGAAATASLAIPARAHAASSTTGSGVQGLRAARVFDGERLHADPSLVLLCGGTIIGVLPEGSDTGRIPVTDLGDVTLMPGLVDAHVHLCFEPTGDITTPSLEDSDETMLERIRLNARAALSSGVTTVRDVADRGYLTLGVRDERAADMPEILCSGPPITTPDGHCWFLGGVAESDDEIVAAVDERAARGVDVVKVMATGGTLTAGSNPFEAQYTVEQLRLLVDRAHRHRLPVTAHAHGAPGIAAAVQAGVDGVEHATFLSPTGVTVDEETIMAMAAAQIFVGSTAAQVPEGTASELVLAVAAVLASEYRAGVPMVCSSDAGASPEKPFTCMPYGVVQMRDYLGMTDQAALRSATSLAADSCGVGNRKGRIRPGYDADLLAVPGNPAADVMAMLNPVTIYRAGRLIPSS
ncbi:MAG: amidohydrolase family protein [Dactylosporangium sp.]|nr:amidohydrolase family protein [Dactylosporangium sp.]NNJ61036.1 amidohydrolase family protein [Dactylosporangium sp.]